MSLSLARRAVLLVGVVLTFVVALPSPVAAASSTQTQADQIISIAESRLGDKYSFASTGPMTFDCSGFVHYVYKEAGLLDDIGGGRKTVAGLHQWFNANGSTSKTLADAQPGDVLIWGRNQHTGIYIGNGYAISALINPWGVTKHPVNGWIHMKLTAVLHVDITR